MSFKNVLAAEILKTKHTHILTASILLPCIITTFTCVMNIDMFYTMGDGVNPWTSLCMLAFFCYSFLYPILIILISFRLNDVEHKSAGFKHLFTLPIPKLHFYFSKATIIIFCLLISLLVGLSLIMLVGKLCSMLFPIMGFQNYTIKNLIVAFFAKLFFFNLSIVAIQLLVSTYFNNVIKSVGVPVVLTITGMLMTFWQHKQLFPYCYSFQAVNHFKEGEGFVMGEIFYWSILYSILFFALGAMVVHFQWTQASPINFLTKKLQKKIPGQ